jgi:hypothetical protein
MSKTLTRQWRKYPSSGNTRLGDGNPLHSALTFDLVHGVNNLHYTQPFMAYVAAPTGTGSNLFLPAASGIHDAIVIDPPLDGEEVFAAQFPTKVPDGMARFCWRLGFYASHQEDGHTSRDLSVDEVNVYLAPNLYTVATGVAAPTVSTLASFDIDALGGTYGHSAYSTPISFAALYDPTFHVIDMSAGTAGAMVPFDAKVGDSWLNDVNVILTMGLTGEVGWAGTFTIALASFTCWWKME